MNSARFKTIRISLLSALVIGALTAAGCSAPPPPPPPPPQVETPQPYEHVVKYPGETLGVIAKWYTGRSQNWTLLREANPELKPNRISIGDVVRIPPEFLVKSDPLPKSAVSRTTSTGARSAKKESPASSDTSAPVSAGAAVEQADTAPAAVPDSAKASGTDDLDQLERELESALAERGSQAAPAKAAAPSEPAKNLPKAGDEAEREKLLDELLSQ